MFFCTGRDRKNGHLASKSYAECNSLAIAKGQGTFGLEHPKGAATPGKAYCLVLPSQPVMERVADRECEDEGLDKDGHRLGGSSRLAVYVTTRCDDFAPINRACPVHAVGQMVPSTCDSTQSTSPCRLLDASLLPLLRPLAPLLLLRLSHLSGT